MICNSTQQPFPGETKVGILFRAIADLNRYLAKSGRGENMMIQLDILHLPLLDLTGIKSPLEFDRTIQLDIV